MRAYQIAPEKPPLPMPKNFPFQPDAGIHNSILMSESFVGLISAATRQKAGSSLSGGPPGGIQGGMPGAKNGLREILSAPAGTDWARLIIVFGIGSVARFSHDVF